MHGERIVYWPDVRDVEASIIAGLIAHQVERAMKRATETWMRDWAVFNGMEDGLAAAARGDVPRDGDAKLPAAVQRIAQLVIGESATSDTRRVFPTIRALELAGLIDLRPDDDYVLAMMAGLGQADWAAADRSELVAVRWVADDPALVERAIWRVFEVEGGGQVSMTNIDRFGGQWLKCFLAWASTGVLERPRLLDACLRTLSLDFSTYRAQWYRDLLIALEPSPSELAERQEALRRLLGSDVSATVSYAVKALALLQRHELLEEQATAVALTAVMHSRIKGTALAAMRLLTTIARADPTADVDGAALEGLQHEHVDVQRVAARLLGQRAPALLAARSEGLAPSLRRELGLEPQPTTPPGPVAATDTEARTGPAPTQPAAAGWPLSDRAELSPVADDLLERLAALMEGADDPIELELVLDALARTGDGEMLRPLRARADALIRRGPGDWDGPHPLNLALASLVVSGTGGDLKGSSPGLPLLVFLHRRLAQVTSVLVGSRPPAPLLATPDDRRGFVSGEALVARLADLTTRVDDADLVAALLRLAPERRDDALHALRATSIDDQLRDVVTHALGGAASEPPTPRRSSKQWWVAASRARAPLGDDPVVLTLGLRGPGQGRPLVTGLSTAPGPRRGEVMWLVSTGASARRFVGRDTSSGQLMPTYVPEPGPRASWSADVLGAWHRWTALIWPHDAEHFMTQATTAVLGGMQSPSSSRWPDTNNVLDALGGHPGRLGRLSWAALGAGISHTSQEDRLLACDVISDLVTSGRLDASSLAAGMTSVMAVASPTRWAEGLGRVADAGHGIFVIATLTRLLPDLARDTRGLYALVGLLHEESIRTDSRVSDPALRGWLAGMTGASKTAQSAAALLAM